MQHRATTAADAPAVSGKRRTAAEQIVPAHPAVAIAHPGGCRLARRKLREINGTGGGHGNAEQKANGNNRLHYGVRPSLFLGCGVDNGFKTENPAFCALQKFPQRIDVNSFIEPC
jgi:hypothetical protein